MNARTIYPADFAQMLLERVGQPYQPSNGTEGMIFLETWCGECQRDKAMREGADIDDCDDDETCPIIAASFRGEAKEWQYGKDGQPCCTAFVEAGTPIPPPKDELTIDMFAQVAPTNTAPQEN